LKGGLGEAGRLDGGGELPGNRMARVGMRATAVSLAVSLYLAWRGRLRMDAQASWKKTTRGG